MRDLRISTGKSRLARTLRNSTVSWEQLVEKLTTCIRTDETFAEYMAMDRELQADIKDRGWVIGGPFKHKVRRKADLRLRSLLTFDIDHLTPFDDLHAMCLAWLPEGTAFLWHTTHKHSPEAPRYRLVIALDKDISPELYEPVARMVAKRIGGMEIWDDTTFQVARIMYLPSASADAEFLSGGVFDGEALSVELVLGEYIDPMDYVSWPHSSRVNTISHSVAEARDPLEAPGVIGAFNRTFDIHQAIAEFDLPYEPTEWDNRYAIVGATGPSGAIIYDDVFLFSHHESDPAFNQNCNAFDLVRVHGDAGDYTQEEIDNNVPTAKRESMKWMLAKAASIEAVQEELSGHLRDEMDDLGDEEVGADTIAEKPIKRLTYDTISDDIRSMEDATFADIDLMLRPIAAAQLDKTKEDRLLHQLRAQAPDPRQVRLTAMREDLDSIRRTLTADVADDEGELSDIEVRLVEQFLAERYAGGRHLMRFGKVYWAYVRGCWRIIDDEAVEGYLQREISKLREERPEDVMELVAAVGESKTSALTGSLSTMLKRELASRTGEDPDPLRQLVKIPLPIINCLNCELHFEADGSMSMHEHNPAHHLTVQINAVYDGQAQCPEWDRFCMMVFGDCLDPRGMIRHLEELGGYVISMSRWLKTWVLFHGNTDTGKSTILRVFAELLGEAFLGQSLAAHGKKSSNFSESHLIGRLLLGDDDFSKDDELPDGLIKKISEEKPMRAELKFGALVAFLARTLPLICANHWPPTRDVSDAFRERALVFDFNHRIAGPEKSDQRQAVMLGELSGILNRFAQGLARLRARGDWDPPIDATAAHTEWAGQSNVVMLYKGERMKYTGKGSLRRSAVHADFKAWVKQVEMNPVNQRELYQRIEQVIGVKASKYQGQIGWQGWELRGRSEEMEDMDSDDDRA